MPDDPVVQPAGRSLPLKPLLIAIPLLLVLAAALNWKSIGEIASGQRTLMQVLTGRSSRREAPSFTFPAPTGSPDAKVKVQVIAHEGDSCHQPLVALWYGIGELDPKHLRVEFMTAPPPSGASPKAQAVELGCDAGVLLNGQNKFVLGSGKEKRTIYLNGPMPGPQAQHGAPLPPGAHGWSMADLATILNQVVKQKYGKPGSFTDAAIAQASAKASRGLPPPRAGQKTGEPSGGAAGSHPPATEQTPAPKRS